MNKISIIGAGAWGTAIANTIANNSYNVCLLTNKVDCLNEKQTMIANFNKQLNELSDAAIISYVNSTFYPAKMVIPASAICPSVVTQ